MRGPSSPAPILVGSALQGRVRASRLGCAPQRTSSALTREESPAWQGPSRVIAADPSPKKRKACHARRARLLEPRRKGERAKSVEESRGVESVCGGEASEGGDGAMRLVEETANGEGANGSGAERSGGRESGGRRSGGEESASAGGNGGGNSRRNTAKERASGGSNHT